MSTSVTPATREAVYERDGRRCIRCGASGPLTLQHRVARGMGGSRAPWINRPANLITLCGCGTTGCHGWVEAHPAVALELGYRVARHDDPTIVPVVYELERSLYLLDEDCTRTWLELTHQEREVRS